MQIIKTGQYIFECITNTEVVRAQGLFTKEEGTIAWLQRTVRPDDVMYDIGANIGLYTLVAGTLATAGRVYAFEPHVGNAARLLRNIRINKLSERCQVCSLALHDSEGFLPFNYTSNESGSSGSQLGEAISEVGQPFTPVSVELKYGITVDALLKAGVLQEATVIKIDVDGNEAKILVGMAGLLQSPRLRSLQVELRPVTDALIRTLLEAAGFTLVERHHTTAGKKAIAKGADPLSVIHNAIFEREAR
jgi:FkbM family methyltransferase